MVNGKYRASSGFEPGNTGLEVWMLPLGYTSIGFWYMYLKTHCFYMYKIGYASSRQYQFCKCWCVFFFLCNSEHAYSGSRSPARPWFGTAGRGLRLREMVEQAMAQRVTDEEYQTPYTGLPARVKYGKFPELYFWPRGVGWMYVSANFERLVLGCIEAKFCK